MFGRGEICFFFLSFCVVVGVGLYGYYLVECYEYVLKWCCISICFVILNYSKLEMSLFIKLYN